MHDLSPWTYYWLPIYRDTQPFEWYQTYATISHFLDPSFLSSYNSATNMEERDPESKYHSPNKKMEPIKDFPPKSKCRVLIVGCGSSRLGEDMLKDGWIGGIDNVDYSKVVVDQMKVRHDDALYRKIESKLNREKVAAPSLVKFESSTSQGKEGLPKPSRAARNKSANIHQCQRMQFHCVDVTKPLPYPDESFDVVVDKGTMDSILCSNGAISNAKRMVKECSRVLKSHGSMVVISNAAFVDRNLYFENDEKWWSGGLKEYHVPKPNVGALLTATRSKHHYVYIASK